MAKYKIVYPGQYTPEEQAVLDAYKAEKDALNNRGDINVADLIAGRIPKGTPGIGRKDVISKRTLEGNYLMPDPTNPLYFDKEYASKSPYGDVIAFPFMVAHDGAFFDAMPYQLRDTLTISGLTHDFDLLKPIYEGDVLYYVTDEQTFTDITPAEGSEFRTFDITGKGRVFNQKGELVCRGRSRVKESLRILAEGSTTPKMVGQDCPDWWGMAPVEYTTDEKWEVIKKYWSEEKRRGSEPLYWEDVNIGDMPIPTVNGPFKTIEVGGPPMMMPEGEGPEGHGPEGEGHGPMSPDDMPDMPPMPEGEMPMMGGPRGSGETRTIRLQMEDPETFAKMVRCEEDGNWYLPEDLPDYSKKRSIIMNFHARDMACRMMTNWMGDHGWISNVKWRIMRKTPGYDTPEYPDNPKSFVADVPVSADPNLENWYDNQQHGLEYDFIISKGYVTDKFIENGEHYVKLAWWVSRLFGKVYEEGEAIIRLPSRGE